MTLAGNALARMGRLTPLLLAALLASTLGTNILDFLVKPAPGAPPSAAFAGAAVVRVLAVLWVSYVLQRTLAGIARPYALGGAFGRFVLLQVALLGGFALLTRLALVMAGPHPPLATVWLAAFLALIGFSLLTIRLLAWSVALAAGARFAALPRLWRAQAGLTGGIATAFLALVAIPAALHLALTLVAVRVPLPPATLLWLGVVDGVVQALQLVLTIAVGVAAWEAARTA